MYEYIYIYIYKAYRVSDTRLMHLRSLVWLWAGKVLAENTLCDTCKCHCVNTTSEELPPYYLAGVNTALKFMRSIYIYIYIYIYI